MSIAVLATPTTATELSLTRLHLMRAGYLLIGVGLALVKWPLLPDARPTRSARAAPSGRTAWSRRSGGPSPQAPSVGRREAHGYSSPPP